MASNFLQLNANKTEVIIFAADSIVSRLTKYFGFLSFAVGTNLRNLGHTFYQSILFDHHVKSLSHTCFFHLRNIAKLRPIVTQVIYSFLQS